MSKHKKRNDASRTDKTNRLSQFFKVSLLGILLFAIIQAVFGNLISDRVRNLFAGPDLRFRYLLLDIERFASHDSASYPLQDESLAKIFGTQVYVQRNAVFERLRQVVDTMPPSDSVGQSTFPTLSAYMNVLVPANRVEKRAVDVVNGETLWMLETHQQNLQLLQRDALRNVTALEIARANPYLDDTFYVRVDDSRHQCGAVDTTQQYFEEEIYAPSLKVLVLDVENISDVPARRLSVAVRTSPFRNATQRLRLHDTLLPNGDATAREDLRFSVGTLTKSEHILIPMEILAERVRIAPDRSQPELGQAHIRSIDIIPGGERATTAEVFRANAAAVKGQFRMMGAGLVIDHIKANYRRIPVRPFAFDDLTYIMINAGGVGSCPQLLVSDAATGAWLMKGNVLVGAVGERRARTETVPLRHFGGKLRVREAEDEMTFLDYLAIRAEAGSSAVCQSTLRELRVPDGISLVLRRGDEVLLQCDALKNVDAQLVIKGYYESD